MFGEQKLRTVQATRYLTPLREGGSVPAIVEADDDGTYVAKFRGAAQGQKALIAELLAGEIGRALGLPVPEIVLLQFEQALALAEPDPEIQVTLRASVGLNLALDYLPGSITYDPLPARRLDPELASQIVWFDAYCTNVDRTARNTNMLLWHRKLWLIDHGAALYFHHNWSAGDPAQRARTPFSPIREHVLLPQAAVLTQADDAMRALLTHEKLVAIVDALPAEWLADESAFADEAAHRAAYLDYLTARLAASAVFVEEALVARAQLF